MGQDISADLLKQINDYYARGFGGVPYQDPATGAYYQPRAENGSSGSVSPGLESYGTDFNHPGAVAQTYSPDGISNGSFNWQSDDWKKSLLTALAAAGGMAFLPGMAAGAAGDAGAAGLGSAAADGVAVGGPMSVGGAAGTGLGSLGAAGGTAAGLGGSALGSGGGVSGLLGSLGSSGLGSLIAPVLGGLLGSRPTTTSTTGTKDIPAFLKPSVFGLLDQTDALRNKLMTPGALQGYDDMRSVGQGLLNQPIAGNGTAQFPSLYPRK